MRSSQRETIFIAPVACVALLFCLMGCSSKTRTTPTTSPVEASTPPALIASCYELLGPLDASTLPVRATSDVVTIDGVTVSAEQFNRFVHLHEPLLRNEQGAPDSAWVKAVDDIEAESEHSELSVLVARAALDVWAHELTIPIERERVTRELSVIRSRFGDAAQWEAFLDYIGLDERRFEAALCHALQLELVHPALERAKGASVQGVYGRKIEGFDPNALVLAEPSRAVAPATARGEATWTITWLTERLEALIPWSCDRALGADLSLCYGTHYGPLPLPLGVPIRLGIELANRRDHSFWLPTQQVLIQRSARHTITYTGMLDGRGSLRPLGGVDWSGYPGVLAYRDVRVARPSPHDPSLLVAECLGACPVDSRGERHVAFRLGESVETLQQQIVAQREALSGYGHYMSQCASCHGEDGRGEVPLLGTPSVEGEGAAQRMMKVFVNGIAGADPHDQPLWYGSYEYDFLSEYGVVALQRYIAEVLAASPERLSVEQLIKYACASGQMEKKLSLHSPMYEEIKREREEVRSATTCSDAELEDYIAAFGVTDPAELQLGEEIYGKYCVACHGDEGRGNGAAAPAIVPPPTNFQDAASWKQGADPASVLSVLRHGVEGTSMASYAEIFSEEELAALTNYVLHWAPHRLEVDPHDPELLSSCVESKVVARVETDPCKRLGITRWPR